MGRQEQERLLDELADLYREVDQAYAGYRCPASSECCRFGIAAREPYVTSIELAAIERAVAARGGPLGRRRRALPLASSGRRAEDACPLLETGGRCSIYASRPLGCRTFWCERAAIDGRVRQPELNAFVRRIKELGARHRPGGDVGNPLGKLLQIR